MLAIKFGRHFITASSKPAMAKGQKPVFNSDGTQVLDRGIWKRFKYCQQCNLIMVERAKWAKNFDEVKYCGDKCRSASKRKPAISEGAAAGGENESS